MEKSVEDQIVDGELVTGNFTLQAQMPMGKSITVSGYIYARNTAEDVNKQLDFLHDVVDRQRLRSEIPELEAKYNQKLMALDQHRMALAELERKQESGGKMTSTEKQGLVNLGVSVKKILEDLEDGKKAIADAKVKVGWKE